MNKTDNSFHSTLKQILRSLLLVTSALVISQTIFALIPDRRDTTGNDEFGWFLAPTPITLSGIGTAVPILGMFSNVWEGSDIMAMQTLPGGDFDMRMLFVDQFPVFNSYFVPSLSKNLLIQAGTVTGVFPVKVYSRGIDSNKEDFTIPLVAQAGTVKSLRFYFDEERYRFNVKWFDFASSTRKIYDKDGNEFKNIDTSKRTFRQISYGAILDFTDDRTDPRRGLRVAIKRDYPENENREMSDYYVTDFNLTAFVPLFDTDTLVFNIYRSSATVTREGIVDEAVLRQKMSLHCHLSPIYDACKAVETKRIEERISQNRYGTANSLGGANRLQAYDMNRFSAGNAAYRAVEYRFNFSSAETPINWYVVGGLKTIFQLAIFAEQGTVNDHVDQLNSNMKSSYGLGLRTIISGIVYRFDLAIGEEGVKPTIFFFYPMDIDPVD